MNRSVGVVFPAAAPPELLPAFAERMEALGFDELWVVEDCFLSGGLTLAATALAVTSRLRVGVGLLPAAVRNAAVCAMEIGTIARMHPGRLSVAFGHGVESWMKQIDARPSRRVRVLGEVVGAVRALLAGERLDAAGSFVNLSGVGLDHPPPHPPDILVGTTGPSGIRLAGRAADGLLLPEGCGPRFVADARQQLDAANAPQAPPPGLVAYAWLRVGEDAVSRRVLGDAVGSWAGSGLYPGPLAAVSPAFDPQTGAPAREFVDDIAVAGEPSQCSAAVMRLFDAGAQRVVLAAVGQDFIDQYDRFGSEVLPVFHRDG